MSKTMNTTQRAVLAALAVVAVVLAITTGVYYKKYRAIQQNPQKVAQDATNELLAEVGKLIELPTGETPTVATVVDVEKLKDQAFFAKAKNGDKVLIYTNARKAYLYSPANNKLIEVAPLNIGNPAPAPAPARAPEPAAAE